MTVRPQAVADTLLPGDGVLTAASAAGIDLEGWAARHAGLLESIAKAAGAEGAFDAAEEEVRIATLRGVEALNPGTFNAALSALLADYYSAPAVLAVLDWRATPPQPEGHPVRDAGPRTWALLERVRARGRIWR